MATASLRKAEVFVHPTYGRAVRATEAIPAGAVVLKERPFFALLPSAAISAEAAPVRAARKRACAPARHATPHSRSAYVRVLTPLCAGAQAVAALGCLASVPERMLAFCAAPEPVRAHILQLFDGGGPAQWPKAVPDSDTFPCAPDACSARARAATTEKRIARERARVLRAGG
jgi:hypothetical protein